MQLYNVLVRPLITEKNTVLQTLNKYAFEIAKEANKPQVKQAVEKTFKVKVTTVNVSTVPGKTKGWAGNWCRPALGKRQSLPSKRGIR